MAYGVFESHGTSYTGQLTMDACNEAQAAALGLGAARNPAEDLLSFGAFRESSPPGWFRLVF